MGLDITKSAVSCMVTGWFADDADKPTYGLVNLWTGQLMNWMIHGLVNSPTSIFLKSHLHGLFIPYFSSNILASWLVCDLSSLSLPVHDVSWQRVVSSANHRVRCGTNVLPVLQLLLLLLLLLFVYNCFWSQLVLKLCWFHFVVLFNSVHKLCCNDCIIGYCSEVYIGQDYIIFKRDDCPSKHKCCL